ncbi:hypothetical protein ACSS7Z_16010 [Microbacterium sp. A82]|uniref:hypothetical protein n=1 Tax=Microbacterium sp. A82 TaxID=3450452 RepID=UPI003F380FB9
MRRTINIAQASVLLRSREDMLHSGLSERGLHALVASGAFIRVRRGWYVDAVEWKQLWIEGQHLLHVLAAARSAGGRGPVFYGVSAAVVLGLPLYRLTPKNVHILIFGRRHGRTVSNIAQHNVEVRSEDIIEVDGIRCTSLDRTVLDLACSLSPEAALSIADAALRRVAVSGQQQDPDLAAQWHDRLGERAAVLRVRGIRQARDLLSFADGRAQLPGESVSRLHLRRLGFTDIDLQTQVMGPAGEVYWMDFAFRGARSFGEFDGKGKYLDPDLAGGREAGAVVLEEKAREDAVRGVTGWGVVRWGSAHIRTAGDLGSRLASFGIRPC